MKKKYIVKTIAFLLIFVFVISGIAKVFQAKWIDATRVTYVIEDMYKQEKNSVDVCIAGNSQTAYGVLAMRMLDKYGISAYGCATSDQPMSCTYFLLKEFRKKQSFSTVILDVSSMYEEIKESRYRQTLDLVPMSLDKIKFARELCKEDKDASRFWSYMFPIIQYHSRWDDIQEQDFKYEEMRTAVFKGSTTKSGVQNDIVYEDVIVDNDEIDDSEKMLDEQLKYFRQIAEYCNENNINLVLIKTPKTSWNKTRMLQIQELADEYGLGYLDFNEKELFDQTQIDIARDFDDPDHLNIRGAEKLTDYLSEYLSSKYEFPDGKERAGYNALKDAYEQNREDKYLQTSRNALETLERMDNERYDIILQISEDITERWSPEMQDALEKLGAKVDLTKEGNKNYVAHLSKGKSVFEQSSENDISYEGKMSDGTKVKVKADLLQTEKQPSIKIGKDKISYENRGLDITVYDTVNKCVVRNLRF